MESRKKREYPFQSISGQLLRAKVSADASNEMNDQGTLSLRKTTMADLDYVVRTEHNDENRNYVIPWPIEKHAQALSDPNLVHLIVEAENPVGYVILAGLFDANESVEFKRIVISDKGRGYGKLTVEKIKTLAFETYHAHRLWLDAFESNDRARAIYEAAGFKREGVLRECLKIGSKYESLVILSMLRHEYIK